MNLILEWPEQLTGGAAWCWIGKVSLPLRWECLPGDTPEPDQYLWFEASCGGRDLLTGNGGTFPGRMSAWCPDKRVSYNVSFSEMGEMSLQARYYVAGFLAGSQPGRRHLTTLTATSRPMTWPPGSPPSVGSGARAGGWADGVPARNAAASCFPTALQTTAGNTSHTHSHPGKEARHAASGPTNWRPRLTWTPIPSSGGMTKRSLQQTYSGFSKGSTRSVVLFRVRLAVLGRFLVAFR
jgi:hypothetical protein